VISIRDPIHGFIRIDPMEEALLGSRPMQRLRFIRQLGPTFLIFPGAEHSRFAHVLGTMHMAGRVYDALAAKSEGRLSIDPSCPERRLVRAAALLHDIGHAPFSHTAEDLFEDGIDHEDMTRRLLALPEIEETFQRHGEGLDSQAVIRLLEKSSQGIEHLLSEIVSGELDVDKMDYLQRDSLYCGVRYGNFDLERMLDTMVPIQDPSDGTWRIGIDHGGVHALEALVMARYYMFTQVYFNPTGKVMELHLNEWLRGEGIQWPSDPERFLEMDDTWVHHRLRDSPSLHARALVLRERFRLAFETREHLSPEDSQRFEALLPRLNEQFGRENLLIDHSAKDPHRLSKSRILVRRFDGALEAMAEASDFIRHLSRIDSFRIYAPGQLVNDVRRELGRTWGES
jgi:HD superfamily phosphohydrolase